jgi:hypothetical protein
LVTEGSTLRQSCNHVWFRSIGTQGQQPSLDAHLSALCMEPETFVKPTALSVASSRIEQHAQDPQFPAHDAKSFTHASFR